MDTKSLEIWICDWIAHKLAIPLADIKVDVPMVELGLESLAALELSGDLEVLLGREVSALIAVDNPTVAAVASRLLLPTPGNG